MENLIYGIHAITEAIKQGKEIDKLFVQKNLKGENARELTQLANKNGVQLSYVPPVKLDKLTKENHQGFLAKISPVSLTTLEQMVENAFQQTATPLFLLLDQISDVRNLGAIIRTAECTGVHGIILPKQGSAALNEQTVKTSTGAIYHVPLTKVDHLKDAIFFLQSYEVQLIAATEKANTSIYDTDLRKPTAFIMGSEGKGISKPVLKIIKQQAKLPLLGSISSLNVSVACGAFLFESLRQRQEK